MWFPQIFIFFIYFLYFAVKCVSNLPYPSFNQHSADHNNAIRLSFKSRTHSACHSGWKAPFFVRPLQVEIFNLWEGQWCHHGHSISGNQSYCRSISCNQLHTVSVDMFSRNCCHKNIPDAQRVFFGGWSTLMKPVLFFFCRRKTLYGSRSASALSALFCQKKHSP